MQAAGMTDGRTSGAFVISLDFEMMWGCIDHRSVEDYGDNVAGVWEVVPRMLSLFREHQIHATWGIVGLLARNSMDECEKSRPEKLPQYKKAVLSTYNHYESARDWPAKVLFARELIDEIRQTPDQEIGSHTYSHYYCAEEGQTKETFRADLLKEAEALGEYTQELCSIIFPRNQGNPDYADTLKECGYRNYRGNEKKWFYEPEEQAKANQLRRRILRLLDCYVGLFGSYCYDYSEIRDADGLCNIRSSRFFRPYSKKLSLLEPLRIRRIRSQMKVAAKHGKVFHLWWHPHNFGTNIDRNMKNLAAVLEYYDVLKQRYGMKSLNMKEIGGLVS